MERIWGKGLTSFQLKLIAIITMTIDHIGYFLIRDYNWYLVFRIIGRIAFVLFAFMVAEGIRHSRHPWKYGVRLLVFGFILDSILWIATQDQFGNIFITLGLGALAALFLRKRDWRILIGLFFLFFGEILNTAIPWFGNGLNELIGNPTGWIQSIILVMRQFNFYYDYSFYGVGLIVGYSFFEGKVLAQALLLVIWNVAFFIDGSFSSLQIWSIMAAPLIVLYNNQRGISNNLVKWGFYVYYPLHLGILWLIQQGIFA